MNFRRTLAIGVVAAAAVAVPATAYATNYVPVPDGLNCTGGTIAPNTEFTCESTGEAGDAHSLRSNIAGDGDATIAGTFTSAEKTVPASGTVSWTVTAPAQEGTIGITLLVDGVATEETATVVVAEELAATGFEHTGLAIGAGALLVVGVGAVAVGARRRAQHAA